MYRRIFQQRSLLTLPQILVSLTIIAALMIAIDLNRRAEAGQLVGVGEQALQREVALETTRQVELRVTLAYVESEDYISTYARNEGGQLLSGEKRVVPLIVEAQVQATPAPIVTPDPAEHVRPWQAWWELLTDAPQPTR